MKFKEIKQDYLNQNIFRGEILQHVPLGRFLNIFRYYKL